MRATICVDVSDAQEAMVVERWFGRWGSSLTFRSENEGCGCCVDIWRVEGPVEAIDELPPSVVAQGARSTQGFAPSAASWPRFWHDVGDTAAALAAELERELAPGHPLFGRVAGAIARRLDADDVVFVLADGVSVAEVHLTWSRGREKPPWPAHSIFASIAAWRVDVEERGHVDA